MFLQPDWFEVTKPGVGTNRYGYSFGDPVNKMDPGGNLAFLAGLGCFGGGCETALAGISGIVAGLIGLGASDALDDGSLNGSLGQRTIDALDLGQGGFTEDALADLPSGAKPAVEEDYDFSVEGLSLNPLGDVVGGNILSDPIGSETNVPSIVDSRGNILGPDQNATGEHSTAKRDKLGKVTSYETWTSNPLNPTGFDSKKRVDLQGKAHRNKNGDMIPTPHTHEAGSKDVRPSTKEETRR